jgi:hypothetical protein
VNSGTVLPFQADHSNFLDDNTRIRSILDKVAVSDSHARPRVLLLQAGFDTLTTDNGAWANIKQTWPGIDFDITAVLQQWWGQSINPKAFTTRGINDFAHYCVRRLAEII